MTRPALGSISRLTVLSRVDLPDPDCPTSATKLPPAMSQVDAVERPRAVGDRLGHAREGDRRTVSRFHRRALCGKGGDKANGRGGMAASKAIFITGGASGIGQATARLFAARGWRVGIADVTPAGLDGDAGELSGDGHSTHELDVRDREAGGRRSTPSSRATAGRLDVLFNNAGIPMGGPFAEVDFDELDRADRDQPGRRDERRADRLCLSGEGSAGFVPAQHRQRFGDLWLGRAGDLFRDQVRRARADRGARRRMGGGRHQGRAT